MGLSVSQSNQNSKEKQKLMQSTAIKQSPILNTAEQCNEWNKLLAEIKILRAKNKQLEKAILDFGNNPAGFDWAVLDRIDKLEAKNKKLRGDIKLWKNRTDEAAQIVEPFEEIQAENDKLKKNEENVFCHGFAYGCKYGYEDILMDEALPSSEINGTWLLAKILFDKLKGNNEVEN